VQSLTLGARRWTPTARIVCAGLPVAARYAVGVCSSLQPAWESMPASPRCGVSAAGLRVERVRTCREPRTTPAPADVSAGKHGLRQGRSEEAAMPPQHDNESGHNKASLHHHRHKAQ
jgi:hypothetical protein